MYQSDVTPRTKAPNRNRCSASLQSLKWLMSCFSSWCSLAFMPAAGVLTCVFNHNTLTSLCEAYKSAQWLHYEILYYRAHLTLLHYPTLSHLSLWISPHPPLISLNPGRSVPSQWGYSHYQDMIWPVTRRGKLLKHRLKPGDVRTWATLAPTPASRYQYTPHLPVTLNWCRSYSNIHWLFWIYFSGIHCVSTKWTRWFESGPHPPMPPLSFSQESEGWHKMCNLAQSR